MGDKGRNVLILIEAVRKVTNKQIFGDIHLGWEMLIGTNKNTGKTMMTSPQQVASAYD